MKIKLSLATSKSSQKGNLAEYMLPALMIGGLVLVSVTSLLQSNLFQNTQTQGMLQANGISKDAQGKGLLNIKTMGQNPFYQPYQYKTVDGKTITIPNFPTNLAAAVEVDGGHGTTEKLLASMEAWIQAMVDAGEIGPNDVIALKQLSRHGHLIASHIGQLEAMGLACGTSQTCAGSYLWGNQSNPSNSAAHWGLSLFSKTSINESTAILPFARDLSASEKKTLFEFSPWLKPMTSQMSSFNHDANNVVVGKSIQEFIHLFSNAKSKLSNSSPQTQSMLKYFSSSILNLGVRTASITTEIQYGSNHFNAVGVNLNEFREGHFINPSPQDFNALLKSAVLRDDPIQKSALAHAHSGGICQMGQGEAKPTECL